MLFPHEYSFVLIFWLRRVRVKSGVFCHQKWMDWVKVQKKTITQGKARWMKWMAGCWRVKAYAQNIMLMMQLVRLKLLLQENAIKLTCQWKLKYRWKKATMQITLPAMKPWAMTTIFFLSCKLFVVLLLFERIKGRQSAIDSRRKGRTKTCVSGDESALHWCEIKYRSREEIVPLNQQMVRWIEAKSEDEKRTKVTKGGDERKRAWVRTNRGKVNSSHVLSMRLPEKKM